MRRRLRRWRWERVLRQLEEPRREQNDASRGRKGPPTEEERERLKVLAERGRDLAECEAGLRARGI